MIMSRILQAIFAAMGLLLGACALLDDSAAKKPASTGLIATPATYYSTTKARYLGSKYKDNLDRMVERITRNPKTAPLQFANNISSVGGIGFFTHSATKTADERYLEVVLATPETFEVKGEHSEKIQRLFSRYGLELLGILNGDGDIYQDRELSGYGLNLAWRNVVADTAGNRVILERAIVYFSKERVRNFIRQEINQNDLLADAVIFAVEEDGPLNLVSYRAKEARPDFRPAIQEDNLADVPVPAPSQETAAAPAKAPKVAPRVEPVKPESPSLATLKPAPREPKVETKSSTAPAQKSPAVGAKPAAAVTKVQAAKAAERAPAEEVAVNQKPDRAPVLTESPEVTAAPVLERQAETAAVAPQPSKAPAPIQEIAKAPVQSLPAAAASKDGQSAETPEPSPREPVKSATPKGAAAKTAPAVVPAPIITVPVPVLPEPAKVAAPTPVPAGAEKVIPTKQARIESVKPAADPRPVAMKTQQAVTIPPPVAEIVSPPPSVEPDKPSLPVKAAKPEATPLVAKEPASLPPTPEKIAAPPAAPKKVEPARQATVTKPPAPASETRTDPAPSETKSTPLAIAAKPEIVAAPVVKAPEPAARPVTPARPAVPAAAAKSEAAPVVESKPTPVTPSKPIESPAGEQLALLTNKPVEVAPPKPALARPAVKSLEGFIIQLAFSDKEKAQRWAESMEKRGYAVSLTEAGAEGSLRVRLGNFSGRDDAERQLRTFKQEGMSGIIINLPQAYRPEARTSIP